MAGAALVLYSAGLTLAFGWRTLRQWRRTGDTGLRLQVGPAGSVSWWAKVLFGVALGLGFAGPIAELAGLGSITALDHQELRNVGLVLAGVGVLATMAAQLNMGSSWRIGVDPGERTALVTTGAFALARNPIFTAMVTTSAGLALAVPNAVSFVATAALVASIQLQVRLVEEPYLERTHGTAYVGYAARVGRFLPGLGRRSVPRTTPLG